MNRSDTSADIQALHDARLRAMSELERAELMRSLTLSVQQLAFAGMRERHPEASDDAIWLRLAVNRLGAATVRRAYGVLPDEPSPG